MSIRLKNLRRGLQDYEYLWLAAQLGIQTDSLVNSVVPAAFNDYNGTTFTSQSDQPVWAEKGYEFERVRRALAEAIAARSHNATILSSPNDRSLGKVKGH
jgi:hypothetical protein